MEFARESVRAASEEQRQCDQFAPSAKQPERRGSRAEVERRPYCLRWIPLTQLMPARDPGLRRLLNRKCPWPGPGAGRPSVTLRLVTRRA
jgi:hypothetical protein